MPDATPSRLRAELAAGGPSWGCFCNLPTTLSAESLAAAGFSFVVVDLQHGGASFDDVAALTQALELGGATPVVRVMWNDPAAVMRALDLGASAVIVPMVNTAEQARAGAEAMRYPPQGIRSFGMTRRRYGGSTEAANADVMYLPMIETAEGLANVDEIAAIPGVDGLFVGPADLALSLGLGFDPAMQQPEVLAAIDTVVAAARRNDLSVGTVAATADHADDLVRRGVGFVSLSADKNFVQTGAAAAVKSLRATHGR